MLPLLLWVARPLLLPADPAAASAPLPASAAAPAPSLSKAFPPATASAAAAAAPSRHPLLLLMLVWLLLLLGLSPSLQCDVSWFFCHAYLTIPCTVRHRMHGLPLR